MKRVIALSLLLSACATTRPGTGMSYVTPGLSLSKSDAATLANDTVQHLSGAFPPAKNTLVLDTPKGDDALTPLLMAQLRSAGFGVIEAERGIGVRIRYLVSPLDKGVVLRLQYLTVEAARFYPRGAGGNLLPAAPFTVKEAK
jgi:hypothetical protein